MARLPCTTVERDLMERLGHQGHVGAVFRGEAEQRRLLSSFAAMGVRLHQQICYLTWSEARERVLGQLSAAGLPGRHLVDRGQLTVLSLRDGRIRPPQFDAESLLGWISQSVQDAVTAGFSGLRVLLEADCVQNRSSARRLTEFESGTDELVDERPVLFLCAYDQRRCGAPARHAAARHGSHIDLQLSYQDDMLRITPTETGLRLRGEMNVLNRAAIQQVLAGAVERALSGDTDVRLDLADLSSADVPTLTGLARTAQHLYVSGRRLVLHSPPTAVLTLGLALWGHELPPGMVVGG